MITNLERSDRDNHYAKDSEKLQEQPCPKTKWHWSRQRISRSEKSDEPAFDETHSQVASSSLATPSIVIDEPDEEVINRLLSSGPAVENEPTTDDADNPEVFDWVAIILFVVITTASAYLLWAKIAPAWPFLQ